MPGTAWAQAFEERGRVQRRCAERAENRRRRRRGCWLTLDLIYVQAKFWTQTVGRPEIQRFYGALHGKGATKGIFMTTSAFSSEARSYAESVTPRVILIDGAQLADLMVEHGVGVTSQHRYEVKRVDLDYFTDPDASPPV